MGGPPPAASPPELQSLVEFVELDDRPTAIFHRHYGDGNGAADIKFVYENGSFRNLGLSPGYIRTLLEDSRAREARDWRTRFILDRYMALYRMQADIEASDEDSMSPLPAVKGLSLSSDQTKSLNSTDWTLHDVPGVSPWIQWVRSKDWSKTDLGSMECWSAQLRTYMLNMMSNPNPRILIWGKNMTFVYNEACIPHFGEKHPGCFGKPIQEPWAETWQYIEPIIMAVYRGEIMQQHNLPLPIWRNGFLEDTYFNYTMLPIHGSNGQIEGVSDEIYETTASVRWDRRRASLVDFGKQLSSATELPALWSASLRGLESAINDVAFALLYSVVDAPNHPPTTAGVASDRRLSSLQACILQGTVGAEKDLSTIPETFALHDSKLVESGVIRACAEACKNRIPVALHSKDGTLPEALQVSVSGRAFGEPVQRAVVTPIVSISGNEVLAVLITGLNPRSPLDQEYSLYIDYLGDLLMKAASLISLPQEQKRAQQTFNEMNKALSAQLQLVTMQAERSEAKFARMAAAAPTGMFAYSSEGRPLYANEEFLRMFGISRDEHFDLNKAFSVSSEAIHVEDIERYRDAWRQLIERKAPVTVEYRLKMPWKSIDEATGQELTGERWMLANAFPDLDYDGKVQSVQGWITDISHRRFTEKLISRRLEEALESKRSTENFIDMTSHEMRNPLSAMLQSADSIISLAKPSARQHRIFDNEAASDILDAAETIVLCAQHQKRIVDDILTLSKLDASLVEMCPEKIQILPLLDQALRMFEAEMDRVDIKTSVIVEPSWRKLDVDWVVLDASRLLQVIINLVTNSIKFVQNSARREITIALGASHEKPSGKHHGVCFVPRAQEQSEKPPLTRRDENEEEIYVQLAVTDTGRGLSEEEQKLLFHRFSQGSPKTYKQYGGSGLGLYISRQLCELQGGQIGASSKDGRTTFTFFVKGKRLRQDAKHMSEKNDPSEARGTPKPFTKAQGCLPSTNGQHDGLFHDGEGGRKALLLSRPLPQKSNSMPLPSSSRPTDKHETTLHVLLVEDNLINQRITAQQLRKTAKFTVHVADDGAQCLDFVSRSIFDPIHSSAGTGTILSIILLDLEMPIMDGWTCARRIRQQQREGTIVGEVPIIALTANARPEQIKSATEAGADAVVTKPFRTADLVPRMRELVMEVARRQEKG